MPRKMPFNTRKKLHRRRLKIEKARRLTKWEKKEETKREKQSHGINKVMEGCGG